MSTRICTLIRLYGIVLLLVVPSIAGAQTNRGRDFWLTEMPATTCFNFGISIANGNAVPANVTISHAGPALTLTVVVAPGSTETRTFTCRTFCLAGPLLGTTSVYHVTSDVDVAVYTFKSLAPVASNDASLILPVPALGQRHRLGSYVNTFNSRGSMFKVVAVENGTIVQTYNGSGTLVDTFALARGALFQRNNGTCAGSSAADSPTTDVTGWAVVTSKPAAVFSGSMCTSIGAAAFGLACDHLEEQILPEETVASAYVARPTLTRRLGCNPALPGSCGPDLFRYVATEDSTVITTTPNVGGATINKGQFVTVTTSTPHIVSANKPFYAFQYLVSWGAIPSPDGEGDPSLLTIPPVAQFQSNYLFPVPAGWNSNFINVVAPVGTNFVLNGSPLTATCSPVGFINGVQYCGFSQGVAAGTNAMSGDRPFALSVTGFAFAGSYGYVAGLGVRRWCDTGGPYAVQSCDVPAAVLLAGAPFCPDGSTPTLSWTSADGLTFSDPASATPTATVPSFGTFGATLEASCPGVASAASCSTTVTVSEPPVGCNQNQPPVAVCIDRPVFADASCHADASVDGGSFDPDGDVINLTPSPMGPYALGPTPVTLNVDDGQEASSCNAVVTVTDNTQPTLTPPGNLQRECTSAAGASVSYTPTATDNCSVGSVHCSPGSGAGFPLGSTTVNCTATDSSGNASVAAFDVMVRDSTQPSLQVPGPIVRECTSPAGAAVPFSVSASDTCSAPTPQCSKGSGDLFGLGTTNVNCTATDPSGNVGGAGFPVTVQDTVPPLITVPTSVTAECTSPAGASVMFDVAASDTCSTPAILCSPGSGSTFDIGPTTVTCSATDGAGHTSVAPSFVVNVTSTAPALTTSLSGNPLVAQIDTWVAFSVEFSDNSGDTHTATWDFGDLSGIEYVSAAMSPLGRSHVYTTPGVYKVAVTITDSCDNNISDSIVVVVVDPAAGFTTGGGWFVPDAASFIDGLAVTDTISKANFGFIVKYKQGQSTPGGNLEFQYKAGDVNLKSSAMDWMVTSTTKVRFKGLATINGTGQYTFKVTAEDKGEPGTMIDTFKIEIWMGVVDTENTTEELKHMTQGVLGGGNIQIH